ncbi:oxygenase MpaB family protein [Sphingobium sp. EM0848]|uniref:oxygenase MpaB family protein n=1 Tax=Sphingobium sp. EM0848 TaxID=2743473 RepID=UPI00159C9D63|nr:oxygenase MpaB family protein [Sphingobium sp. EM0848]
MDAFVMPRPAGLDVPADLSPGRSLGRTVNYDQAVTRFGRQAVEVMVEDYKTGDELGYAAYKALVEGEGGAARAKGIFEQVVNHGIESVENPPVELVALFKDVDQPPSWVDWEQLQRGSIAYWRAGKLVVMTLAYGAIGAGFRTYGGSRPLVLSRRLIERNQAGQRLVETLRWAANSSKPDGMRRNGDGFRMTMNVRWIHAAVRYHLSRSPHWDWADWGMVVSNTDSVYTMGCLFCEAVVNALRKVGVGLSAQEVEDITALWRYIGHIMGIPEAANFSDWRDLQAKSELIRLLEHPADEGCRALMKALSDYMCEEEIEGYEVIPAFIARHMTVTQKKRLTYGLMRAWAGDDICEQLAIPNNRLRYLVPAARPFVATYDWMSRLFSRDDREKALRALDAFGAATKLRKGETEVADPDDVIREMKKFESRAQEILVHR